MKGFSNQRMLLLAAGPLAALMALTTPAGAQTNASGTTAPAARSGDARDAQDTLNKATATVRKMENDRDLRQQIAQAKGVFVVPHFGRAALGVGAQGGEGVMLQRQANGQWGEPVFYNMGGLSAGLQAGASGGSVAFLLMNQKAVDSFKQENNFSLDANAGLSVIDWSARGQASVGKGDVVAWSDTKGLFGGAAIGVSDIHWDKGETQAFYGQQTNTSPQAILEGTSAVKTAPAAQSLKHALARAGGSGQRVGAADDQTPANAANASGTSSTTSSTTASTTSATSNERNDMRTPNSPAPRYDRH